MCIEVLLTMTTRTGRGRSARLKINPDDLWHGDACQLKNTCGAAIPASGRSVYVYMRTQGIYERGARSSLL